MDVTKTIKIKLQYSSLINLVATFGGLAKGLTLMIFFLVYPIREIKYYRQLINSMFSVCLTPE
jgi:hypothetical protein